MSRPLEEIQAEIWGLEAEIQAMLRLQSHAEVTETESFVLQALRSGPLSKPDLLPRVGLKTLSGGLKKALDRLAEVGLVEFTIPEKPRSKKQKRRLTSRGERVARQLTNPAPEADG